MEFKTKLKCQIMQGLMTSLLEDVNYEVVPLGHDHVLENVRTLSLENYKKLNVTQSLRRLPDFFIYDNDMGKGWLVEVKLRAKWNAKTRAELHSHLMKQVESWKPLHMVIFLGEHGLKNESPKNYIGVLELTVYDKKLGAIIKKRKFNLSDESSPRTTEIVNVFKPWETIEWDDFQLFQSVFGKVGKKYGDHTLNDTVSLLKALHKSKIF